VSEAVVLDASAWVDLLLGGDLGQSVKQRVTDHNLHAPAHIDIEMLSAFGRLRRAGDLTEDEVSARLARAQHTPIRRHLLADLTTGAWSRQAGLRISDAFYVELATMLGVVLITTDRRLARATAVAEVPLS